MSCIDIDDHLHKLFLWGTAQEVKDYLELPASCVTPNIGPVFAPVL